MKLFDRQRLINVLSTTPEWDVVVIGGGATGLGIAVDAAARGCKILLLEQNDFAKATSSRSTKLIHGGVRYLAQGNVRLVREALRERGLLLKNAPHLSKNESFIIPCYSWFSGFFFAFGLKIYDWLSGRLSLGKSELIGKKQVLKRLPGVQEKNLKCGVLYHDGAFDDARLALNLAQTCIEKGGVALNYCKVTGLTKNHDGKVSGVVVEDVETGNVHKVRSNVVINATGVFVDDILRMDNPVAGSLIKPSQGIHLVLDRSFLSGEDAIMIPRTDDGRVLFVIPWYGKVLVGTTDTPLETHALEPRALEREVDFVLANAGKYLSKQPMREDVLSVFAGLRPLAAGDKNTQKTKEISRGHKIIFSKSNLVSVIGGKWTTYRKMAEDTLGKIIQKRLLPDKECKTADLEIHGYRENNQGGLLAFYGADEAEVTRLAESDEALGRMLDDVENISVAQVAWAVRHEMARTVEDVLARRTRVLFLDAKAALRLAPEVASIMMKELGKSEEWKVEQLASFSELAAGYLLKGNGTLEEFARNQSTREDRIDTDKSY